MGFYLPQGGFGAIAGLHGHGVVGMHGVDYHGAGRLAGQYRNLQQHFHSANLPKPRPGGIGALLSSRTMKAYLVQVDIAWRDKEANFAKVRALLASAGVGPGGLVVLPEMFATGFDVEFGDLAEGEMGNLERTGEFLAQLARETGCTVQGTGISRGQGRMRRNLAVAYAPDGTPLASFTKLHPFTYGGEHKRFESGKDVSCYTAGSFTVSPLICYDLRFPEAFRQAMHAGAQVFCVVANWPRVRQAHWLPLLQARAIENQAYVLGVNRCGSDKFLDYAGESVAFGPRGEQLALAGSNETVLTVDLDGAALQKWREEFPVLNDIHGEFLGWNADEK